MIFTTNISVLVRTKEQFEMVKKLKNTKAFFRIYIEADLLEEDGVIPDFEYYLALPRILRVSDEPHLTYYKTLTEDSFLKGFLVRNLEEIGWLGENGILTRSDYEFIADANLYAFNNSSIDFYKDYGLKITLPLELKKNELSGLDTSGKEMVVYGRVPLMVSAGCVHNTLEGCNKISGFSTVTDRTDSKFLVYKSCLRCENIIYNSIPTSLHQFTNTISSFNLEAVRIEFTDETSNELTDVVNVFFDCFSGNNTPLVQYKFTKGYFKRGVE